MTSTVIVKPHNGNGKGVDIVVRERSGDPAKPAMETKLHADEGTEVIVNIWHGREITSIREVESDQ